VLARLEVVGAARDARHGRRVQRFRPERHRTMSGVIATAENRRDFDETNDVR
jgi:hypothetical protein